MPIETSTSEIYATNNVAMLNTIELTNLIKPNTFVDEIRFSNLTRLKSDAPDEFESQIYMVNLLNMTLPKIYKEYIEAIRLIIGDYPEVNKLLNKVFYKDCQYIEFIKQTLKEFNLTPPLTKKLTLEQGYGKIDNIIIYGSISHAYRRLADASGRNNVPWQGGELAINLDKTQHFDKWFEMFNTKYQHYLNEYKRQANMDSAWGVFDTGGVTGWGWW
jgi:hypothetical protein